MIKVTVFLSPGLADVWFSLNGTTYHNNSLVTLEDIGENDTALLCITNLTACCQRNDTGKNETTLGNWFFPNGTIVPSNKSNRSWDFYMDRGEMVVHLNRREGREDGIYRCEILDSTKITQTIYIGVYNASTGEI